MTPSGGRRRDFNANYYHQRRPKGPQPSRTSITIDEESLTSTTPARFLARLTNLDNLSIEKETFSVGDGKRVLDLTFPSKQQLELFKRHIRGRRDVRLTHDDDGNVIQDAIMRFKRQVRLSKATFMDDALLVLLGHEEKIQAAEEKAARVLETGMADFSIFASAFTLFDSTYCFFFRRLERVERSVSNRLIQNC